MPSIRVNFSNMCTVMHIFSCTMFAHYANLNMAPSVMKWHFYCYHSSTYMEENLPKKVGVKIELSLHLVEYLCLMPLLHPDMHSISI
jgi:hypothetical protein